jgi:hypothetical protein
MSPKSDKSWAEGNVHSTVGEDEDDDDEPAEADDDGKGKEDKDKDYKDDKDETDKDEEDEEDVVVVRPLPPSIRPLPVRPGDLATTDDAAATPTVNPPSPTEPVAPEVPEEKEEEEAPVEEEDTHAEENEGEGEVEAQQEEEQQQEEQQQEEEENPEDSQSGAEAPEGDVDVDADTAAVPVVPAESDSVSLFTIFMSAGVVCLLMAALGIRLLLLAEDTPGAKGSAAASTFEKMAISEVRRDREGSSAPRREGYQTLSGADDLDEEAKGALVEGGMSPTVTDTDKEFGLATYQRLDDELAARRFPAHGAGTAGDHT